MSYTVEIFRDLHAQSEIDINPALAGVAIIGAFSTEPTVLSTTSKMKISHSDAEDVRVSKIRWPNRMRANINVVLTDRSLVTGTDLTSKLGVAHISNSARVAIVSTTPPDAVIAETTAHEIGHLIGVPNGYFDKAHCDYPHCIMHEVVLTRNVQLPDTATLINKVRKHVGLPVMKEEKIYSPQAEFCESCAASVSAQMGKLSTEFAMQTLQNYKP